MSLAEHVRTLGRGPGRSRSLTQDEAADAMRLMLEGAAPEAVGALLMLLRMKGETAEEIAGFAGAAAEACDTDIKVDLDWPSYAAGRTRGEPWFLLSAKLVAQAGFCVGLHGWNGPDGAVRAGVEALGIGDDPEAPLFYRPLEGLVPSLFALLRLREVLGLRSCINTVCRMLNPFGAAASVQGVFHPSYRLLQADAAGLLGWHALSVVKGGGGEFEVNPSKPVTAFGLREAAAWEAVQTPSLAAQKLSATDAALLDVWSGARPDPFAEEVVIATASLALDTLGVAAPRDAATALWADRHSHKSAA